MYTRFISLVLVLFLVLPVSWVSAESATSSLDSDAYLEMLLTQLAYQDPSEPMSNAEMVAQLADLTMMEQSAELTEAVEGLRQQMYYSQGLYASAVVGKGVMVLADLFIVEDGRHPDGEVLLSYSTDDLRIDVYPDGESVDNSDPVATLEMGKQSDGQIPFDLNNLSEPLEDGTYRMYANAKVDGQDVEMSIVHRSVVKSVVFPGDGQDVLIDVAWIGLVPVYVITEFQGDYVAGDAEQSPEDDSQSVPEDEPVPEGASFSDFGENLMQLLSAANGSVSVSGMRRRRRDGETWTSNPLFELKKSQQNNRHQPVTRRQVLFRTL